MQRRSADDQRWKDTKKQVRVRDGNRCRLLRVVSAKEAMVMQQNAGPLLSRLDAAHIYPVSQNIAMTYEVNNIVMLNRWSHSMLDSCHDPVTGQRISKEQVMQWWQKIAGEQQWQRLQNVRGFLYGRDRSEET